MTKDDSCTQMQMDNKTNITHKNMKTSKSGIDLIKKYEGLRLKAYKCPAGIWTIGYGHTNGVMKGDVTNEIGATEMLKEDLVWAERAVTQTGVELNQNQFDALVSLTFNIGSSNFKKQWLEVVKENPNDGRLYDKFMKWVKATDPNTGEKVTLPGLVKRRKEEAELYFEPYE